MLRRFALLLLVVAVPARAQYAPLRFDSPRFNPAAEYVTVGQDEPGYRRWAAAASWRPVYIRAFNDYLISNGVGGVAPTWQLLRTATDWHKCGADPFEVPPVNAWPNIVATLRYIGAYIVPVMGPVEPVSVYRNATLNQCAGGAATSTHREMGAVDMVPLRPIPREALMSGLCRIHAATVASSNAGLGFYKGIRFHIDSRKYREWGTQGAHGGYGCTAVLAEGAARFDPGPAQPPVPQPPPFAAKMMVPPTADPLAPQR